jgi:two-component system, cell cycle response regulator
VHPTPRILLIDPNDAARKTLAERLLLQGFVVTECRDGAEGAIRALEEPPSAVVADLSMPSISGVQLCRLLGSESSTNQVPVILRGYEGRRNHFWAEQAGAFAYVVKGRMGELVRALRRAMERTGEPEEGFFVVSSTEGLDVRERIAAHLDSALFDSVIASEVRRLGSSESFDRLLDLLSQFISQVTTYRWMAVLRHSPARMGVHANSGRSPESIEEARQAFRIEQLPPLMTVEDDDAVADPSGPAAITVPIIFGEGEIGHLALAPRAPIHQNDPLLVKTIARELGGALRMATLVEESRHMATTDALTGLMNRRAFMDWAIRDVRRSQRYRDPFSVVMVDVDHFKHINDKRGHNVGDIVLSHVGRLLGKALRSCDVVARWGGEEFIIALPSTPLGGAVEVAERARAELENASILDPRKERVPVTASLGASELLPDETFEQLVDRADRAMYAAKSAGRNRVSASTGATIAPSELAGPAKLAEA